MPGKLLKFLIPVMAATLLLAVACGSEEPAAQPAVETAPASEPAAAAVQQQQTAPTQGTATEPTTQTTPATSTAAAASTTSTTSTTSTAAAAPAEESIRVVTTSNIIADWVEIVGQDRVDVFSLLPANADPHTYQPGAQDIAQVADADLVMSVGLSLETGWLTDLVENAAKDPHAIVEVGEEVDPIDFVEIFEDHHDEEGTTELLGKLLIGDGETGALSIIELDHGEVEQDAYDMGSRAGRIYATNSGRFAVAVSSDANMVHVIDGGTYLEPHDGHFDMVNREAEAGGTGPGRRPAGSLARRERVGRRLL